MLRIFLTFTILFSTLFSVQDIHLKAADDVDSQEILALAKKRAEFDWSVWKRIPTLHQGRIKPLDTLADEIATIITGRSYWEEPDPEINIKYRAPELLFAWISERDKWLDKSVIRCEFRPLRKLFSTEEHPIKEEGKFVAVSDILDLKLFLEKGERKFHSEKAFKEIQKVIQILGHPDPKKRDPSRVGKGAAEKALNKNLASFIRHFQLFLSVSEGRNIYVVPGLDPRTLAKQFDTDNQISSWVPLSDLLKQEEGLRRSKTEEGMEFVQSSLEPTVTALLAKNPEEFVIAIRSIEYPVGPIPQFAQLLKLKAPIMTVMKNVKTNFEAASNSYQTGDTSEFSNSMKSFSRNLRELAEEISIVRPKLTPPEPKSIDFGKNFQSVIWSERVYKPLELDKRVIESSAYPPKNAVDMEITYNKYQPFRSAWIFFLVALIFIAISGMVKIERTVFFLGVLVSLSGIAYSTWGFTLRGIIAGRPPVTNMYETVIWVSFVVAVLGTWFCVIPFIWPGLSWSWRLAGLPLRVKRNSEGKLTGIEADRLSEADKSNFLSSMKTPIQLLVSVIRIGAGGYMLWVLTSSETSFKIIDPLPVLSGKSFSINSLVIWCLGMGTAITAAWYLPRTVLALCGSVITIIPEAFRNKTKLWTSTIDRKYFLLGALPVACMGMMLAHFVGVSSPDILNPRIGSITAVLRNNYWLTIHVLTIVSSYGAGALAWGLGNIALLYYFLGKYQKGVSLSAAATEPPVDGLKERIRKTGKALSPSEIGTTLGSGFKKMAGGDEHLEYSKVRPPREVNTLATYSYKSMQVAVLLLAAGTILGGLWADVSWGRFWDWDPKEVWALICLLVYIVVLHGRFAGWTGTFGTNAGAVLCFSAVMMSWYGVNFVLPKIHGWLNGTGEAKSVGLHSYASGDESGLGIILLCVGLNILLLMAAWARYYVETIQSNKPSDKK